MLFFGVTQRQFLAVNKVFHNIFCHIKSGTGHIIIASALSCIDLKELELAVSSVVFDIKIGKSHIMQFFEQIFDTHHQFLIRLCDNDCMIAQSVRCMLFKKHMTKTHHFHLAVVIRIGCQHTHILIITRNHILNDQFACITGPVNVIQHLIQFLLIFNRVHLLLCIKRMLPVLNAVGWLQDHREWEIHLKIMSHLFVVDNGSRIIHAMFLTKFIECLFLLETVHQIKINIWCNGILRQFILMLADQCHIAVTAAHQNNGLVCMLGAEALHCLHKNFICVNLRVWCIFNNSALVTRTCGKLTKCIGLHFITFIKCTGNTVCIDVPAKQHRYKISFFEIHC